MVIILNTGDTLTGEIDYRGNKVLSSVCRFRKSDEDSIVNYAPFKIKAFRFTGSKYFISKEIGDETGKKQLFLEYLIKGKVNIYYSYDGLQEKYYIEKEDRPLVELPYEESLEFLDGKYYTKNTKTHIGILMVYIDDAPKLKSQIYNLEKLNHNNLVKLAEDYHNIVCEDESCIIYEDKLPLISIAFEPNAGVNIYPASGENISEAAFEYGLLIYSWSPRTSKNIYLKTGILFHQIKSHEFYNSIIKIPFEIQYLFPERFIRPKIFGGIHFQIAYGDDDYHNGFHTLAIGAGANIKLCKRIYFSVTCETDFTPINAQAREGASFGLVSYSISGGFYIPIYKE